MAVPLARRAAEASLPRRTSNALSVCKISPVATRRLAVDAAQAAFNTTHPTATCRLKALRCAVPVKQRGTACARSRIAALPVDDEVTAGGRQQHGNTIRCNLRPTASVQHPARCCSSHASETHAYAAPVQSPMPTYSPICGQREKGPTAKRGCARATATTS